MIVVQTSLKKPIMLRSVYLIFAVSFFTVLAAAETQSGTVVSGGQPIPGAAVIVDCGADRITTVTDAAGRFAIGGLPAAPCRYSIAMFGFEPAQRDAAASANDLTFDLKLQTHATLAATPPPATPPPAAPQPPVQTAQYPPANSAASSSQTPNVPAPAETQSGPGRGGFARRPGAGRGGFPNGGRGGAQNTQNAQNAQGGGRGGQGGFQNLSLVQNGDTAQDSADVAPGAGPNEDASASNEAFLVNGTVSQGVQPQAGDFAGIGGPGGFGPGGPGGGPGGNPFGQNGPSLDNSLPSLGGGPAFGAGPGGPGGGGGGGGGGGAEAVEVADGAVAVAAVRSESQLAVRQPDQSRARRQFQGSVYYTVGNSVLNARPYSFTSPTTSDRRGSAQGRIRRESLRLLRRRPACRFRISSAATRHSGS